MKNVHVDYLGEVPDYTTASRLAQSVAKSTRMREPTIVSWYQHSSQQVSHFFDGAKPDSWWEKYGEGNGGALEVSVGDEYDFVIMDSQGFETHGEIPLRNLSDQSGNHYLCFTPILGRLDNKPNPEACTELDGWLADQF